MQRRVGGVSSVAVVLVASLVWLSCRNQQPNLPQERASGEVTVEGWKRPWTLRVERCFPLKIDGRQAIRLYGHEEGEAARSIEIAEGPGHHAVVRVGPGEGNLPGEIISAGVCKEFTAEVRYTGYAINDVELARGHIQIDCTQALGTARIRAQATFDNCQ